MNSSFNILSLNCRSIYPKLAEIKELIYDKKPDVVCLCETWAVQDRVPSFINYTVYWSHRTTSKGGGLAILVRADLISITKVLSPINSPLEVQAITIELTNMKLDILNLYNPNLNIQKNIFKHYFRQLSPSYIIVGDFNAHHSLWSNPNTLNNHTGIALSEILLENQNLCLATPCGLPTYMNPNNGSTSTLDLHFTSANLISSQEIVVCKCVNSDHYPLMMTLKIRPRVQRLKFLPKWKLDNLNWENWAQGLKDIKWNPNLSIDESNEILINCLTKSKYQPKSTTGEYNPKYNKPWWNNECSRLVALRRKAKNVVKRNATAETISNLRRAENEVKKAVDLAKENSLKNFVSTIDLHTTSKTVWDKVNSIRSKFEPKILVLNVNNELITDLSVKTSKIADHFEAIFNIDYPSQPRHNSMFMNIQNSILINDEMCYNGIFTAKELQNSLALLKNTSPGADRVHNLFLKNAPDNIKEYILELFNHSWLTESVPNKWLESLLIPVCKPQKDPSEIKSYRPISLLSCISKLMERMVAHRLEWLVETKNLISSSQSGFRKQRSTVDQLLVLDHGIKESMDNGKYCIVVFVDLMGAFDRVWILAVLQKLVNMGIRGRILGWLYQYLHGRTFRVFLEGKFSSKRKATSGVPQGGVLSPLLFNVLMSDLPKNEGIEYLEFADDIAIYSSGYDPNEVTQNLEKALEKLQDWVAKWGQTINLDKTKAMYFTKKTNLPPQIKVSSHQIEYLKEFKYLGLTFDSPRLSYKKHIMKLKDSCTKSLSVIKFLSHLQWGCNRETLLTLYKTLVRSKIDYASQIYQSATQTDLKILDTIQNQCIRLCIGAWETSPITSLEVEANIPPLKFRRELLLSKMRYRINEYPTTFPQTKLLRAIAPRNSFMERSNQIFSTWNLELQEPRPCPKLSPIPPWNNIQKYFRESLSTEYCGSLNDITKQLLYQNLVNDEYSHHTKIFTDGSKMEDKIGAALVVPELKVEIMSRIPNNLTIMSAELFAIKLALEYLVKTKLKKAVIFTDSLSSITKLKNSRTVNDRKLRDILELIYKLNKDRNVYIQWIPSHCGIHGNDLADNAAKRSLGLQRITHVPKNLGENILSLESRHNEMWQKYWEEQVRSTQKGRALKNIRDKVGYWPWTSHKNKRVEVSIARLRIGHVGLNSVKHRFQLTHDPYCQCGEPETIDHFLLTCNLYQNIRNVMKSSLNTLDSELEFTTKTLLGGSQTSVQKQMMINEFLSRFLISSGKVNNL